MFIKLAYKSLFNRKGSVLLTIMAMTVSIFVLLGVEHIRHQTKEGFSNTVSGVDLIVGARTSSLNLLLYSVFRIGSPSNNIRWDSYKEIASQPDVKWAIPVSLGDSHKGYRVVGTTEDYFKYFNYANQRKLDFEQGHPFKEVLDVVLGYEVAQQLRYRLGDQIILSHGIVSTHFSQHDDRPFTVTGILTPTGTPVDQALYVSLQGIEAIHIDWQHGVKISGKNASSESLTQTVLQPSSITAFMLGLKSKIATFHVQKTINQFPKEPLIAILPGVALSELWQMMGLVENTLRLISVLVLVAALLGLSAMLLASIRERHRELQLLRIIGASPLFLFLLIELEALLMSLFSIALATSLLYLCFIVASDFLSVHFGLYINANILSGSSLVLLTLVVFATTLAAAIPALSAYKSIRINQSA